MGLKVLIVEDDRAVQKLLRIFLEREGFLVTCASTIHEAEHSFGAQKFDLVVADIYLSKGTGIDLLRYIRDLDSTVQVVLITGHPDVNSASEALRLGASDYIAKPINPEQIISMAQHALRNKQLTEENRRKQAHLDAIFHSTCDAIILVDRENRLLQINEAAMRSCRYTLNDLGKPVHSIDSGCKGICRHTLHSVLGDGVPRNIRRLECCTNAGRKKIVNLSASPVVEDDGTISGAVAILRDETELVYLEQRVRGLNGYGGIIGGSPSMQRMYALIEALADVQTTVLINGESGTGKELVALALHFQGSRRSKPFVKVNCAALSEHLLESELFGHIRGAFTGAVTTKVGRFQKADGGTIFLDEIGDISLAMQMRLLRVLQEQEFEMVGDSTPVKVDVRVIAATNQDLAKKVKLGTFRHDLFYRLNVVRLIIPPLRERKDDIPLLVTHFLELFSQKFKRTFTAVSHEAMELFMRHAWPGNVRELEHTIEHAAILCPSTVITIEDLPQDFMAAVSSPLFEHQTAQAQVHDASLQEALAKAGGNKAKAARLLGLSRSTIYRMLQENDTEKHLP